MSRIMLDHLGLYLLNGQISSGQQLGSHLRPTAVTTMEKKRPIQLCTASPQLIRFRHAELMPLQRMGFLEVRALATDMCGV
jgi:hypothetical protein